MKVRCQCNTIAFVIPRDEPLEVYFCHCSECQLQSSSAFGTSAIFASQDVKPLLDANQQQLQVWKRSSKTGGVMNCFFCKTCGTRIAHLTIMDDGSIRDTVSVKGGCLEGLDVTAATHIYTRNAVVPVPDDGIPGSPSED